MNILEYAVGYALGRGLLLPLFRATFSRYGLALILIFVLLVMWS